MYSKMEEIPELNDMKAKGVVSPFMRCIEMFIRRDRVKSVSNDTKDVEREVCIRWQCRWICLRTDGQSLGVTYITSTSLYIYFI